MEHIHPHALRQPRAEVARRLEVVAGPTALADEGSGDQNDRSKLAHRRLLGERIYEDRRSDRMADHDCAGVQICHLPSNRRAPPGVTRVVLVGHTRVADLTPVPEAPPKAFDQLVVPFVVRARAAALDEQNLPSPVHGDRPRDFVAPTIPVQRRSLAGHPNRGEAFRVLRSRTEHGCFDRRSGATSKPAPISSTKCMPHANDESADTQRDSWAVRSRVPSAFA